MRFVRGQLIFLSIEVPPPSARLISQVHNFTGPSLTAHLSKKTDKKAPGLRKAG